MTKGRTFGAHFLHSNKEVKRCITKMKYVLNQAYTILLWYFCFLHEKQKSKKYQNNLLILLVKLNHLNRYNHSLTLLQDTEQSEYLHWIQLNVSSTLIVTNHALFVSCSYLPSSLNTDYILMVRWYDLN